MNTVRTKLRAISTAATLTALCAAALPVQAQDTADAGRTPASKQQRVGMVTGLAVGAAAGGPVGAIVGLTAGAWMGDRYHRQAAARQEAVASLDRSEGERARLASNVAELNGSLAQEQDHGEKLDLALSQTNDVETDVSFRTNDDAIQVQAVSPLLKFGALAAALPDAKVRVAGYADPRGADKYNMELSKRRAEAVASILTAAGVDKDRLIIEAHGKSQTASDDGDLDGYALERKVTVRIERPSNPVARNQ